MSMRNNHEATAMNHSQTWCGENPKHGNEENSGHHEFFQKARDDMFGGGGNNGGGGNGAGTDWASGRWNSGDLTRQFNHVNGGGNTEMGSRLTTRTDGDVSHQTSYNKSAEVHFSVDVSPTGQKSGRHFVDHETGKKAGERDF